MRLLIASNTIALALLIGVIMLYIDTHHKLNSCKFNPDQRWCYTDLHCGTDSATDYKDILS